MANLIGGTVTEIGADRINTFTSSGTLTVLDGGLVHILAVGAGGGGGILGGGGGGSGEVVDTYVILSPGTYTVTVGAGGLGGPSASGSVGANGSKGGSTTVGIIITAEGGGGGRGFNQAAATNGASGGGGSSDSTTSAGTTGGAGTSGYPGGVGVYDSPFLVGGGGGGGGVTAAGSNATGTVTGGAGGPGYTSTISGASVVYGGGGGGAGGGSNAAGGGAGGAGGRLNSNSGINGVRGGGGGGGAGTTFPNGSSAGNGGAGIVIFRCEVTGRCVAFRGLVSDVVAASNVQLSVASSALPDALSDYRITFYDNTTGNTTPTNGLLSAGPWTIGPMDAGEDIRYAITRIDGAHIDGSCVMRATDTTFGLTWDVTVQCPANPWGYNLSFGQRSGL